MTPSSGRSFLYMTTPTQTATTPSRSGPIALYVVAAAAALAMFAARQLSVARVAEFAWRWHGRLAWVAAAVLLPVVLFGSLDFARSHRRGYQPPSVRVQLARALGYGLGLSLANALWVLAVKPELVSRAAENELPAGLAFLSVTLIYAALAWASCLRRRRYVAAALPSFKEAALALRDTNDFLLGRTGSEWKSGRGDARWYVLPEQAMFANLYCLGGIGSGKTSAVAKPLLEQALFKFPRDARRKVGIFLLDAKGNNADHVLERAAKAGREKDVIILRPGGAWTCNPLAEGNPTALANKLVAGLESMTDQESNTYYRKMQREFAENAFQVLADVLGPGRFTFMDVYDFICDDKVQKKYLAAAAPKNSVSSRWFANQWAKEDSREQMMLTKGFRADLSSFVRDEIAPTFCVASPNFPGWTRLIEEGLIVVFSMSLDEYGDFARAMGIFMLMDFQSSMLVRSTTKFRRAGGNVERLVFCFVDEVWAYMNPKLAEFTSVSREARCCTLALHQSLAQVPPRYRDVLTGNLRTPIILSVNDMLTLQTFSGLFGTHKVERQSRSEASSYSGVERQLLSDGLLGRAGGESKSVSISHTSVDEPRFSTDDILRLPKSTAVVQMFDGDNTVHPTVVHLLPGFLPENELP
jgi:hypothetical protein